MTLIIDIVSNWVISLFKVDNSFLYGPQNGSVHWIFNKMWRKLIFLEEVTQVFQFCGILNVL